MNLNTDKDKAQHVNKQEFKQCGVPSENFTGQVQQKTQSGQFMCYSAAKYGTGLSDRPMSGKPTVVGSTAAMPNEPLGTRASLSRAVPSHAHALPTPANVGETGDACNRGWLQQCNL